MIRKFVLLGFLSTIFHIHICGQELDEKKWKRMADDSKTIVVGVVEKRLKLIRPEKYKPNSDGSIPSDRGFTVGELFRVKVTQKLKGKVRGEKVENIKYLYIFMPHRGLGSHDPAHLLIKGKEYVFFLVPSMNEKEFVGLEIVEYRTDADSIIKTFEPKPTYLIVYEWSGIVEIKGEKDKLIKEIKKAI